MYRRESKCKFKLIMLKYSDDFKHGFECPEKWWMCWKIHSMNDSAENIIAYKYFAKKREKNHIPTEIIHLNYLFVRIENWQQSFSNISVDNATTATKIWNIILEWASARNRTSNVTTQINESHKNKVIWNVQSR